MDGKYSCMLSGEKKELSLKEVADINKENIDKLLNQPYIINLFSKSNVVENVSAEKKSQLINFVHNSCDSLLLNIVDINIYSNRCALESIKKINEIDISKPLIPQKLFPNIVTSLKVPDGCKIDIKDFMYDFTLKLKHYYILFTNNSDAVASIIYDILLEGFNFNKNNKVSNITKINNIYIDEIEFQISLISNNIYSYAFAIWLSNPDNIKTHISNLLHYYNSYNAIINIMINIFTNLSLKESNFKNIINYIINKLKIGKTQLNLIIDEIKIFFPKDFHYVLTQQKACYPKVNEKNELQTQISLINKLIKDNKENCVGEECVNEELHKLHHEEHFTNLNTTIQSNDKNTLIVVIVLLIILIAYKLLK